MNDEQKTRRGFLLFIVHRSSFIVSEERGVETVTPKDAQHAVLLTQEGPDPGRRFPCADDMTTIGRQADCGVCLESPAVSRHHARIVRSGDDFFVEDPGSSN